MAPVSYILYYLALLSRITFHQLYVQFVLFQAFFLYGWNIGPLFNLLENYQLSALI